MQLCTDEEVELDSKGFGTVGAFVWPLLVNSHVPPYTACHGEDHAALSTLEHTAALVSSQVIVQTRPRDKLLATFVAYEGLLPSVTSRMLLQMTAIFKSSGAVFAVILPSQEFALSGIVH